MGRMCAAAMRGYKCVGASNGITTDDTTNDILQECFKLKINLLTYYFIDFGSMFFFSFRFQSFFSLFGIRLINKS